jgi:5-carboxymethyl-2-hydroxymuconate isomerase
MPLFNIEKIESLRKKQEIKNLKEKENEVVINTSKIQKLIEDTKDKIVWQ